MTILEQPTTSTPAPTNAEPAHTEHRTLAHPVFGAARKATVVAETLTRYRVSIGGTILGYLDAITGAWTARAGLHPETAMPAGQHRTFAGALRLLTNP
jgi:hypothetical protein